MSAIPILTYHQIDTPPASGAPYRSLVVSPAAFARQMALLKTLGYRGMSMNRLEPYLRGEKSGKVVGITLDDGYSPGVMAIAAALGMPDWKARSIVAQAQRPPV